MLTRTIDAGPLRYHEAVYLPGQRMEPHSHRTTSLSLVVRGAVEEGVGADERQATSCALVVKPAGTVHRNRFGPGGAWMASVELEEGFEARLPDPTPALERWRWLEGGPAARVALRLLRTADGAPERLRVVLEDALWELLDAVEGDSAVDPASSAPPFWLRRARDRLRCEGASPPRVSELARGAGVHPVSLTRAFRRAYGLSVTEYARRMRVRAAADALASTDEPLARVAFAAGFADQSHLGRVFRHETGLTPAAFRALAAGERGSIRSIQARLDA